MRPLKIVGIVVGALLVIIGLALIAPGGFLLWAYGTQRDSSGFFETSNRVISTDGYALITPDVDVDIGSELGDWIPMGATGAVRIRAASTGSAPLFVGVGPTDQVSGYLAGVEHDEVGNFGWLSAAVEYTHVDGGAPSSPPGEQAFWVARQEGPRILTLEWEVQGGNWTAVIMNGDASAPVVANVSLGARFGALLPIGIGLTVAGVVALIVGIVLIILGARPSRREPPVQPSYAAVGPPQGPPPQGPPPQGPPAT